MTMKEKPLARRSAALDNLVGTIELARQFAAELGDADLAHRELAETLATAEFCAKRIAAERRAAKAKARS